MSSRKFKGQIMSMDFFLAVIIFVFIAQFSLLIWNKSVIDMRVKESKTEMGNLALEMGDLLIKGGGLPDDWNATTVRSLGLAKEDHVLDEDKVSKFVDLPVVKTRELLGMGSYQFYFLLRSEEGDIMEEYGDVPMSEEDIILTRRLVMYGNNMTYLDLSLWRP